MPPSSSAWLDSLPHQIPFRAASSATRIDENTMHGTFACSGGDALFSGEIPSSMVFEAMAQLAGGLAFSDSKTHAWLTAIDEASLVRPPMIGDMIEIRVEMDARFERIFRFRGVALCDGLELARAKFYLAEPLSELDGEQ